MVSSNQENKPEKTKKLRENAENVKPQNKIMPSTAKQAETNAFESVRATPFTRVHGRPTRSDYEVLKEEACTPASEVDDITYAWIKNVTDNYIRTIVLANILGVDEYHKLPFRQEKTKQMARSYFSECDKKRTTDRNPLANNGNKYHTILTKSISTTTLRTVE